MSACTIASANALSSSHPCARTGDGTHRTVARRAGSPAACARTPRKGRPVRCARPSRDRGVQESPASTLMVRRSRVSDRVRRILSSGPRPGC
jgi:hypothetical protein